MIGLSLIAVRPTVALVVCCLLAAIAPEKLSAIDPPALPQSASIHREDLPEAFRKETPDNLGDLQTMQRHVEELANRVFPAVVAVRVGGGTGSGVVISEDGLVLSAAHVGGEPNRDVRFTFPNGKTARGKTLGSNHGADAGLMRITDEGKWPHVEVGSADEAVVGDWVLALGHPGGFEAERSEVVRLGRIIRLTSNALQTDCPLVGGDSGGPLFDMHGRVIGIHSRISDSTAENFHVAVGAYYESWDRLAKGENWGDRRGGPRAYVGARGIDHPDGCLLDRVEDDGPASKAGLKAGDILMKANKQPIQDYASFVEFLSHTKPGDEVTLAIKRDDQEMSVKVTVEARRRRGRPRP